MEASKRVVLREPESATVDGVELMKNDTDNPTELKDEQIERLKRAPGVRLDVLGPSDDPLDSLSGRDLDERFKASGIVLEGKTGVDEKRQALKDLRDKPPSPEGSTGGDA